MKIIFIILILAMNLFAEDFPKTNTRYVLIQSGVLNVREKPVDGNVLAKLKAGDTVTILDETEPASYGWKKVKTSGGIVGFTSEEFIGYFPITEIQKAKLIGVVGTGDSSDNIKKGALRILGASFSGKWYGFDGSGDFNYLLNYAVSSKKTFDISQNAKKVGSFKAENVAKYGCQEFKGISGTASSKELTSSNEKLFLGTLGISESKSNYSLTEKISADLTSNLLKEAVLVFKKNKVSAKEIENISEKKIIQITTAKDKSYLVARYAIKKEFTEKHSVSFVAEILKNNEIKLIHSNFETLQEERGNYGGSFHFMGILDLDNSGVPAILFHHIGFDSGIYEIFRITKDKIESVFLGGGDAC
ncbi:MAG TPA: SH3 domain-containing protein [Leptospiraceae bacterium]|nr:SH3 domain-containing protein [Leptospiraceae bacterium]